MKGHFLPRQNPTQLVMPGDIPQGNPKIDNWHWSKWRPLSARLGPVDCRPVPLCRFQHRPRVEIRHLGFHSPPPSAIFSALNITHIGALAHSLYNTNTPTQFIIQNMGGENLTTLKNFCKIRFFDEQNHWPLDRTSSKILLIWQACAFSTSVVSRQYHSAIYIRLGKLVESLTGVQPFGCELWYWKGQSS